VLSLSQHTYTHTIEQPTRFTRSHNTHSAHPLPNNSCMCCFYAIACLFATHKNFYSFFFLAVRDNMQ
jgi:hypothetical protein